LISGIPDISPYNVYSALNPILVQVMALGYHFNMYRNKPASSERRHDDYHASVF
jgi:hypothetical protein